MSKFKVFVNKNDCANLWGDVMVTLARCYGTVTKETTVNFCIVFIEAEDLQMQQEILNSRENDVLAVINFQSDDLLEKLKILNYEKQLLSEFKMKPLSRFYFVKSFNPGEQFFMFTLIFWWLCRKMGKIFEQPQEFDDPNITVSKIMQILQQIDIPVEFHQNKLLRGAGSDCVFVLDTLATQVLKVGKVIYQRPIIAQEDETAIEYLEDNAEIILEKLDAEDDHNFGASDDESDMDLDGHTTKALNWSSNQRGGIRDSNKDTIGDKLTDQQQWRLELERVLPQLKVVVKGGRDWRSHWTQIEKFKNNTEAISEDTQAQLKKLHSELTFNLDKVESREKHLNNELQPLIKQLKDVSIETSNIQYASAQIQTESSRVTEELNDIIAENDTKKMEMERRGQSMADSSSVVQIKKAINRLKEDVGQLNLEVALLLQALDQEIIRKTGSDLDN